MERIRGLNRYQKCILLAMLLMVTVFAVLYLRTVSREGFSYEDEIFVPERIGGGTVYSGEIHGKPSGFTVYDDKSVYFQYGDKTYGPYTAKADPSAVPEGGDAGWAFTKALTGVEVRRGEEIIFRGGVADLGNTLWLEREDAGGKDVTADWWNSSASQAGEAAADPTEPPVAVLLTLMGAPKLTHKGSGAVWFMGAFLCIVTAVSILFADELFRWSLSFRIRHADRAEPTDWELAGRYIGWTLLPVLVLVLFALGLR